MEPAANKPRREIRKTPRLILNDSFLKALVRRAHMLGIRLGMGKAWRFPMAVAKFKNARQGQRRRRGGKGPEREFSQIEFRALNP
jgi:hypothetical protein